VGVYGFILWYGEVQWGGIVLWERCSGVIWACRRSVEGSHGAVEEV
jgi:hypothetical protein